MDGSAKGYLHSVATEYSGPKDETKHRDAPPKSHGANPALHLIDPRTFERECFEVSVGSFWPGAEIKAFGSVEDWRAAAGAQEGRRVILFNIGGRRIGDSGVRADLTRLVRLAGPVPVVVLAVSEVLEDMLDALEYGVRGYIPASVGMAVTLDAVRLAADGGMFLPAPSVSAARDMLKAAAEDTGNGDALFTKRQAAVAEALRRGKANKLIAYELGMCESTVKVHIRTIMKRLKASNRTEAAFKLHELMNGKS
ncbi:LuxR C-terminal-related transcriptional regulator [Oceaniglobus roseus]|uniref:LuxR C-terminal-related transcriptional regulator n=1 Tax=Oceaniglobus roseus TaxID=1737570 RepID=UPI000C7EE62C|nr:response regulator transcription factor [Kandeliimicrobium roseum]